MKKTMKLLAVLLTIAVCAAFLFSCGASKEYKFGVILQIENGAFTDMRDGILDALNAAGYTDENTEFVVKCAQGDTTALSTIASEMDDGTYDAVFTIATAATQQFVNLGSDTPCFFCAVSDPLAAKVVSTFETPDKNATGTSNAIPVSEIFALANKLTPNVKKYGIIYCTSQTNAVSTAKAAREYFENNNIAYEERAITESSDVKTATEALVAAGVDAIFIPNDQIVQASITSLVEICRENKIPTYCSSATTVSSGCFATLAIDDHGIGEKTVAMALEYLKNGKTVSEIPTIVVGIDSCSINSTTADAIGVTDIPTDLGYEVDYFE